MDMHRSNACEKIEDVPEDVPFSGIRMLVRYRFRWVKLRLQAGAQFSGG
jgi:hypothetical protein